MSCSGCVYTIGKEATCNRTYNCNTSSDRPTIEEASRRQQTLKEQKAANDRPKKFKKSVG
jgi:hypothetical protein